MRFKQNMLDWHERLGSSSLRGSFRSFRTLRLCRGRSPVSQDRRSAPMRHPPEPAATSSWRIRVAYASGHQLSPRPPTTGRLGHLVSGASADHQGGRCRRASTSHRDASVIDKNRSRRAPNGFVMLTSVSARPRARSGPGVLLRAPRRCIVRSQGPAPGSGPHPQPWQNRPLIRSDLHSAEENE
jgi:hypothetical protein